MKHNITDYLLEYSSYDPDTGIFTRKKDIISGYCGNVIYRAGSIMGSVKKSGYIEIKIQDRIYLAHRLAWLWCYGEFPPNGYMIDHINRNGQDNRIVNLRLANYMENSYNRSIGSNNNSGYKGVHWHQRERKWYAEIYYNKQRRYLGSYNDIEEAYAAYCKAAKKYHKQFACI